MTRVIDIDAHAEPPRGWLDDHPALRAALPEMLPVGDPQFPTGGSSAELFAWFVTADLQRGVAPGERMPARDLVTPALEAIYDPEIPNDFIYPGADQHQPLDADRRVAWLDRQGIDVQMLISGEAYTLARAVEPPALAMDALEVANRCLVDGVGTAIDRLKPVTTVRLDDLDRAIAELERMRGLGSRMFLLPGEPVCGIPHFDPHFDRLWAAACDLGMVAMLHVGLGPASMHPGWARTHSPALLKRMATSVSWQAAPVLLNAMVFGGVFERHPALTLVISEYGIDWLPFVVANMEGRGAGAAALLGDYDLPLSPTEYLRRNVRVSPLPSPAQLPLAVLDAFPEVAVFSTDHPHIESNPEPIAHYEAALADLDPHRRRSFLGASMLDCFERVGDPL